MSDYPFDPNHGPIEIEASASGPSGSTNLNLILDTGATVGLIKLETLRHIRIDPSRPLRRAQIISSNVVGTAPIVMLTRLSALGHHRFGFPVVAHTLPEGSAADGLLGLDFLRGQVLTIDFRAGRVTLA